LGRVRMAEWVGAGRTKGNAGLGTHGERRLGTMATILLAEDDKDVADLLADILQDYTTVRVGDGKAAVQKARELKPDLVLMDKNMPVMNGIEACRIIKSDPELKSIPVIMLTGEGQMSTVETAIELGADDYVQKPFTPKRLIQHIELVLAKARKA